MKSIFWIGRSSADMTIPGRGYTPGRNIERVASDMAFERHLEALAKNAQHDRETHSKPSWQHRKPLHP